MIIRSTSEPIKINHAPIHTFLIGAITLFTLGQAPFGIAMQKLHATPAAPSTSDTHKNGFSHDTIRNTIFGTATLAATGIGLLLPHTTAGQIARMRAYFLGALTTQTVGSVAKNMQNNPASPEQKTPRMKMAIDVGYGLYNLLFVDIARRLPVKTPANIKLLRTYSTFCLLSQGAGVIARDSCAPYCASLHKKITTLANEIPKISDEHILNQIDFY